MTSTTNPTYIIAVSGGIDSVVLLDMIANGRMPGSFPVDSAQYVVAHVDHGIRPDSRSDLEFVRELALKYGFRFESTSLSLGPSASEDTARTARYAFLESVATKYKTNNILIAHHADDVMETALLNLIRGTGRRGLSSMRSKERRIRPLLHLSKNQLRDYAKEHSLSWVEDSTNSDPKYLRNKVRTLLEHNADDSWHHEFTTVIKSTAALNDKIDNDIEALLGYRFRSKAVLDRSWFVLLDHMVGCEVMNGVLSKLKVTNIDKKMIERLVVGLKVAKPGSLIDIDANIRALITKRSMRFVDRKTNITLSV